MLALWSFLAYALAVGGFALSANFWLSFGLLGVTGMANSLQAVMRQTTFHLLTPQQVRGRAFAVFHMFSQGANSVGATEVGFMAALHRRARRVAVRLRRRHVANVGILDRHAEPAQVRRQLTKANYAKQAAQQALRRHDETSLRLLYAVPS